VGRQGGSCQKIIKTIRGFNNFASYEKATSDVCYSRNHITDPVDGVHACAWPASRWATRIPHVPRIEHASDPDQLQKLESITYKRGLYSSLLDSSLKIVWSNGRFRMKNANLVVVDKEKLDKQLNQIRALACDFGWKNTPKSTHLTFVDDDLVALYVRKIRYVNGVLYCTGRDLPIYVDIQKEYWWVVRDPESLPPPHKEEFAKLKGKDKNNMVWVPRDSQHSEYGRWEWEK